ncbi:FAR1 DNA binding domain-containing protein [Tanacetum coccineum]
MVLIVEDKATLVPHSESKLDMDVAQDDPNENNGTEDEEDNESEEDEEDIVCSNGDVEHYVIRQRDKRSNTVVDAMVSYNQLDGSINCSCGHFNLHGFLCRHVFCLFGIRGTNAIPQNYISRRWRKNPLPAYLRDKRHRYGPCIEESEVLAFEIYSTVEDCINLIRNDLDKLRLFLSKVKDLKKELEIDAPSQNAPQNKNALYEDLWGVKAPVIFAIKNPQKCSNKCHHIFKGAAKKDDELDEDDTNDGYDEYEDDA